MIYLVTNQKQLFSFEDIKYLSLEESLTMLSSWDIIQFDSETTGRDAHLCDLLCVQFGDIEGNNQIVVDTITIDILKYKHILESHYIVGQNLKFDLQFLYNYGIVPRKVYDTMIVEQFLYLGYPAGAISYSLKEIAWRRLGINIDKSVRGEIIWRGLDFDVVKYAAGDVQYLGQIMQSQLKDLSKIPNASVGAKLECDFIPVVAYLEWCGIKLDEKKWLDKMNQDKVNLEESLKKLNDYCVKKECLKKWVKINTQGDLFLGYDLTPKWTVDWQKNTAIDVIKALGFNTKSISKRTKKESDSIMEKVLNTQRGIDDEFLKLYFEYQGKYKVITSFGQGHLDAINPKTGRLHTIYRAIGTVSGRMSCGSKQSNTDLAKYKKIVPSKCKYPNLQQLPHDAITRACFVAEKGNKFISCDYSSMEARIGAEVYNEKVLLDEFLYGSGDTHSVYAKVVFDELKDMDVKDIKKKRPDLRNKVKPIEFAIQFGSDGTAVAPQLGVSVEEAKLLVSNLLAGMKGLASFKIKGSAFVRKNGYVNVMEKTGHRIYWWDHDKWLERQKSFTPEFWEDYKKFHKGTGDTIANEVKEHFQAASKWDRMALNGPTQGGGAICLKHSCIQLFNWIMDNSYFGKILLVNFTHDEINSEAPESIAELWGKVVSDTMEETAGIYYHKLSIPAEASIGDYWIH